MSAHESEQRLTSQERQLARLDRDVSGLKEDMASVKTGQDALGKQLGSVLEAVRENRPKPQSLLGIGSVLIALTVAATGYISTRLSPTEKTVEKLTEVEWAHAEWQRDQAREAGGHVQRITENEKELETQWAIDHEQIDQIARLETRVQTLTDDSQRNMDLHERFLEGLGTLKELEFIVSKICPTAPTEPPPPEPKRKNR